MSARLLLLAALLAWAAPLRAAAPPAQPLPSQLRDWIAQLGHDDPDKRQAAFDRLRAAGPSALDALEAATRHPDAQVRRSARSLVADFRRGIFPDTPDDVVALINRFEGAQPDDRRPLVRKLLATGHHGCRALFHQLRHAKDADRKNLAVAVFAELGRAAPALADSDDLAALAPLLQLAAPLDPAAGVHFAAYHLLMGTLDAQIERLTRATDRPSLDLLAYLHRARGDLDRAVAAARKSRNDDLVAALLVEKGDWKALVAETTLIGDTRAQQLGHRLTFARLAGDDRAFRKSLEDLADLAKQAEKEKSSLYPFVKPLWFNGRSDDAMALFEKRQTAIRLQYDLKAIRWQIAEATAVAGDAVKNRYADHQAIEITHARTLHLLGQQDEAAKILKRYADLLDERPEGNWQPALVEVELALGRRTKALAIAAKILKTSNDPTVNANVFDRLFGDGAEEAARLWLLLRRPAQRLDHAEALTKLDDLIAGDASKEDVEQLMKAADRLTNVSEEGQSAAWLAAGDAADRAGHSDLAADCFRKAASPMATVRLGDLAAKKGKWLQAGTHYSQAFRQGMRELATEKVGYGPAREAQPALALYLYGRSLQKLGLERDGNRRIEQAHLLPLGSAPVRYHLLRELQKRKDEGATREQLLLRRLGELSLVDPDAPTAEGFRLSGLALMRKDPLKAADEFEKAFLRILRPEANFARDVAYVTVPALLIRLRAEGLAKAGRYDEAMREARRCLTVLPGDVDLAGRLVPLLEAKKRQKDADEVYDATKATYAAVLKKHPKSPLAHNQLAWLSATCKRELDRGLASARKAVELSPENASYHDTLAEVLFQSGKKKEAIAAQRQAIQLAPRRKDLVRQLKRIEAGDPKAPREE